MEDFRAGQRPQRGRWFRIAAGAAVVAGLIAIGAAFDHSREGAAGDKADVSAWYCEHGLGRCNTTKPETIERRWEIRERIYEGGFALALLVCAGAIFAAFRPET